MRTPRHSPPPADSSQLPRRFSHEERCPAAVRLVSGYLSQMAAAAATTTPTEEEDEEGEDGDGVAGMAGPSKDARPTVAEEAESSLSSASANRRKRHGVEKYVSDSSQLNLQFERRRSAHQYRPQSGDILAHHSPLRYRTSLAGLSSSSVSGEPATGMAMYAAQSYLDSRSASRPSSSGPSFMAGTSSGHPPMTSSSGGSSSYELSRVRSSPALAAVPPPSSTSPGRFPFHYTPHPPTGTPPTLRELDAR